VATRTFHSRLEALEDRLAPAGLLSQSPPAAAPGISVALSAQAELPLAGSVKVAAQSNLSLLGEGGIASAHTNLGAKLASSPALLPAVAVGSDTDLSVLGKSGLLSAKAEVRATLDAPLLPQLNVNASVGAAAPGGQGLVSGGVQVTVSTGSTSGGVEVGVGVNPPAVQLPPLSIPVAPAAPAATPAANTAADNRGLVVAALGPAATNFATQATFLFAPGSTADQEQLPDRLEEVTVPLPPQAPAGGRLAESEDAFVVGGSEDLEALPAVIAAPGEPAPDAGGSWEWWRDAVPALEMAGASPVTDFQPGQAGEGESSEAEAPVLSALIGEGGIPTWLVFMLAVSGLAAGRLALPGRERERETRWTEGLPTL